MKVQLTKIILFISFRVLTFRHRSTECHDIYKIKCQNNVVNDNRDY